MKLSISNLAWEAGDDLRIYGEMARLGFTGLEVAPGRIVPEHPYDHSRVIKAWADKIRSGYGFEISSLQSIWYGRKENIFASEEERGFLLDYTKKAIEVAGLLHCPNVVFGCPLNRTVPETPGDHYGTAISFFRELGAFAVRSGTVIAIEPVASCYHTNFLNTVGEAVRFLRDLGAPGVKLNLDAGTMLYNGEASDAIQDAADLINHVHFSEPGLLPVRERKLHRELIRTLSESGYDGYYSIEMRKTGAADVVSSMEYVRGLFTGE